MKKYAVLALSAVCMGSAFADMAVNSNAQLAVQNETTDALVLSCQVPASVKVQGLSGNNLTVAPGGSTAVQLKFQTTKKKDKLLLSCTAPDHAVFAYSYSPTSNNQETMQITASGDGLHNFSYDPAYTGSVVYR